MSSSKIVGWADSVIPPNEPSGNLESSNCFDEPLANTKVDDFDCAANQEPIDAEQEQDNAQPETQIIQASESTYETPVTAICPATKDQVKLEQMHNEAIRAISSFKFESYKHSVYGNWQHYFDVTKTQVDDVKLIVRNAERYGNVDYFTITHKLYEARKRAFAEQSYSDDYQAPNLDDLANFLENRYEYGPEGN